MIEDTVETPSNNANADPALAGDTTIFIPAGKLDADQYMVSDLDGVTESLFGSGNMNFLMMQSAQTNELAATRTGIDFTQGNDLPLAANNPAGFGKDLPASINDGLENLGNRQTSGSSDMMDFADVSGGGNNALAVTSLSNTAISSTTGGSSAFAFVQNISDGGPGSPPIPPASPVNGVNGTNGTSGTSGTNGTDGTDGTGGPGDTIINNLTEVVEDITNVTILDTTNLIENITNNTTDILTTITNNVFDTINNIFNGGPDFFPIGLDLLLELDQLTNINLDIFSNNIVFNVLDETLDTTLVTNITDVLGDITTILGVNLLIFPFTPDTNPNDQDITVIGDLHLPFLPPIDLSIPLDPVEALLGDIDLNLDLTNELLGSLLGGDEADTDLDLNTGIALLDNTVLDEGVNLILNPVENLLGDADLGIDLGLDLFGDSETDNTAGDTDIVLPLDLDITNSDLLNDALNISLDPIEAITGDIDLDITAAIDLLGNAADNLIDPENGGNNDDGLLSLLGNVAEDIVSPLFPETSGGDTDLDLDLVSTLIDAPLAENDLDLELNPVEDLAGDLDISLSPVLDLLGAGDDSNIDLLSTINIDFINNPLADGVLDEGLALDHLPLADLDTDLLAGTDILGDLAPSLIDNGPGGSGDDTFLSHVGDALSGAADHLLEPHDTNLLGDAFGAIDNTLDTALDLLGNTPDTGNLIDLSILDNTLGTASDLLWTENTLPDTSGLLGGGLGGDLSDVLPDPVGVLPDLAATTNTLLGGEKLFGGLFG